MAVAPEELAQISREFQHFAKFTRQFFDTFEQFQDELGVLKHPEAITVEAIQALRNVMVEERAQWESYRDGLQRTSERLAALDLETPPDFFIQVEPLRHQVPAADPVNAAAGFIAVVISAIFTIGVMVGMWIAA